MATKMHDVRIRAMQPDDIPDLSRFGEQADQRLARHLLDTDPAGCWIAEGDREVVGYALGMVRELLWILTSYTVLPSHQGQGIGRQLFAAAAQHGRGCLRALLAPSADLGATRAYRAAGFELHPLMQLTGSVDRTALPLLGRVREGTETDRDLLDSVDRRTRGAAHGPDHHVLLTSLRLVVADRTTGSGYAYLRQNGTPALLAATNRRIAADLLWEALGAVPARAAVRVERISAANQWALDVGLAAGLSLSQSGFLGVRRLPPPAPYLPHRVLL